MSISSYLDEWCQKLDLDNWADDSSLFFGSESPTFRVKRYYNLVSLNKYLQSRIWSERYPELKDAFSNFQNVLSSLIVEFDTHYEENKDLISTKKFYKIPEYNPKRYDALLKEYLSHVELLRELWCDFSRAANYLCKKVRQD